MKINADSQFIRQKPKETAATHNTASTRHTTIEVKNLTNNIIPNARTATIGKTTYNVTRKFGTRPLEDIMLEHMLENKPSPLTFDARPKL